MNMRCIVIGAGVAGLTTSLELLQRGNRVTMLEARDRMGGRIYTFPLKKYFLRRGRRRRIYSR